MFRFIRRALVACTRRSRRDGRADARAGRRPERLERHRPEPGDRDPADGARSDTRHGDGAGRRVRRGQRARPEVRAVSAEPTNAPGAAVRLPRRGDRNGCTRRARGDRRSCAGDRARHGLRRDACGDPALGDEGRGRPRGRGRREGDARRPGDGRVHGHVRVRPPRRCGPLAASLGDGDRPRRVGRKPEALHHPEPVAVPLEGPERRDECGLREGLRRGEVARRTDEHDTHGRPDDGGDLLAVRADRSLQPARA